MKDVARRNRQDIVNLVTSGPVELSREEGREMST